LRLKLKRGGPLTLFQEPPKRIEILFSADQTNTGTVDHNQDQTLGQDNVGEFADETADLDDTNAAVPIAVSINVDLEREKEEEEEKQPRRKNRPKLT
jgi:hypothetical protein